MGELWQDPKIEQKFHASLGEETWGVFQGVLDEIQDLLGKLLAELQKNIPVPVSSPHKTVVVIFGNLLLTLR